MIKPAPGTWGTLASALLIAPFLFFLPSAALPWVFHGLLLVVIVAGLFAIPPCTRRLGIKDPGLIVIDEAAGLLAALSLLPGAILADSALHSLLVCVVLFRFFDIIKPWPIPVLERLPGALGVIADDVLAGLLAGACAFVFLA